MDEDRRRLSGQRQKRKKDTCLGSTTFIWAFYLFYLQTQGKYFNWNFSVLQKMHLSCADCTTPGSSRDCDHKKHSPGTPLSCNTQVSSLQSSVHSHWKQRLVTPGHQKDQVSGTWRKRALLCATLHLQPSYTVHDRTAPLCWADLWQSSAPHPAWSISHALALPEPKLGYPNGN